MRHKPNVITVVVFATIAIISGLCGYLLHRPKSNATEIHAQSATQLWTCGMHPQVIRDRPGTCPICNMKLVPLGSGSNDTAKKAPTVAYWWDPMLGPSSITHAPGKSAMGMDLVPVYDKEAAAGPGVHIDPAIIQNMGVRTAVVTRGPLQVTVRAVATLEVPQPATHDVALKFGGYIENLYADTDGMAVSKGEVLFDVYSPELQVVEQELIAAHQNLRSLDATASPAARRDAQLLFDSTALRLRLWDLADADIAVIAAAATPPRSVPFRSPATGHVEEKSIVAGSAASAGQKLMRIENHTTLWLDAQVYEDQIEQVKVGQPVHAALDGLPGQSFTGTVSFIYPHLDHMTRTEIVRTLIDNRAHALRPGMYAAVDIVTQPLADAVRAPSEAVIDTGMRKFAFVADPMTAGHFDARDVTIGVAGDDDQVQILSGLAPGEQVVTSGQFLIDVESRTTAAIEKLRAGGGATATSMEMPAVPVTASVAAGTEMLTATPQAPALVIAHCPMKNADWLQLGDVIVNPYYGTAMPACGSVTRRVQMPAAGTPMGAVVTAYLAVAAGLDADRVGHVAELQQAIDAMPDASAALHQAAAAMAAAENIGDVRTAFKGVGKGLIASMPAGESPMEMH